MSQASQDDLRHHHLYLADPIFPAHPPEAGSSQDDGGELILLIQLLQTRVQVPSLERVQEKHGSSPVSWESQTSLQRLVSRRLAAG